MTTPAEPRGLALTLREQQHVSIGDNIRVWICEARGGTARLVISAPTDLRIGRHPAAEPRTCDPEPEPTT